MQEITTNRMSRFGFLTPPHCRRSFVKDNLAILVLVDIQVLDLVLNPHSKPFIALATSWVV